MITGVIIITSIVLAAAFAWAWIFRPALREQIEHPKHSFQQQIRAYDQHCERERTSPQSGTDDSR